MPSWFGFPGYQLCRLPTGGVWRVSSWSDPFDPPPPAPPLGENPADDDGHRYDDPAGRFKTLYCATEREGAIGERIGEFAMNAETVVAVEAFFAATPPEEQAEDEEDYRCGLSAEEIDAFGWRLALAAADPDAAIIDTEDWRTQRAVAPAALPALAAFGVKRFDREVSVSHRRPITRTVAGVYRTQATDSDSGDLNAAGLRFLSRLPPAWECWALWQPVPLEPDEASFEDVTIETDGFRLAAAMLGVVLYD